MKTFLIILKILAALLAIAGIIYIVATYGDRIVAWFKKLLNKAKPLYSFKRNFDEEVETVDTEEDFEA